MERSTPNSVWMALLEILSEDMTRPVWMFTTPKKEGAFLSLITPKTLAQSGLSVLILRESLLLVSVTWAKRLASAGVAKSSLEVPLIAIDLTRIPLSSAVKVALEAHIFASSLGTPISSRASCLPKFSSSPLVRFTSLFEGMKIPLERSSTPRNLASPAISFNSACT